jgi:hypothetical protein
MYGSVRVVVCGHGTDVTVVLAEEVAYPTRNTRANPAYLVDN